MVHWITFPMCISSVVKWFLEWSPNHDWCFIISLQINLTTGSCTCVNNSIFVIHAKIDLVWLHFYFYLLSPLHFLFILCESRFEYKTKMQNPGTIEFLSSRGALTRIFICQRENSFFFFFLLRDSQMFGILWCFWVRYTFVC